MPAVIRNHLAPTRSYGPVALAGIRFIPGATPTVEEQWGVSSLTRNGAGDYTITLLGRPRAVLASVSFRENDTTLFHFVRVEAQSDSAGTVQISHKSVAFASIASGPTASDTVDAITVLFFERTE